MLAPILLLLFIGRVTLYEVDFEYQDHIREQVQKDYPGEEKFVRFPGKNNETDIVGYFNVNSRFTEYLINVDEEDVFFVYYSRNLTTGVVARTPEDLSRYIDKSKKIKFVTHGWLSSSKADMCQEIVSAYLNKSDVNNIVLMDWSVISGNAFYLYPMMSTTKVAEIYSNYLNYLVEKSGVDPADIHLIGHSLGAHVSGFAARAIRKGKIGRITGLDPAGPGFNSGIANGGYLNKSDATFVDIIHTCAGFLGIKLATGHVDFYPNGGTPTQPGCFYFIKFDITCSHGNSWRLFVSSIPQPRRYLANKCPHHIEQFSLLNCNGEVIPMGEYTPTDSRGNYYGLT